MSIHSRATACLRAGLFGVSLAAALVSCGGGGGDGGGSTPTMPPVAVTPSIASTFATRSLVGDVGTAADHTDAKLVNAWGIAFNPTGFVWVANNGSATSTLYDGNGVPQTLVVAIPPGASGATASPTGIVFNGNPGFQVTQNGASGNSAFIFAAENGTLSGWSPGVNRTNAIVAVDNGAGGAVYKGLAIASFGGVNYVYAADFRNGVVDVYDSNWRRAALPGNFTDPNLPAGYAPFGIQALGGRIYVAYALRTAGSIDETKGDGRGIVDVFEASGVLVRRLVTGGALNAPWGMAMAPANFGDASNMLLVGNFGDGKINAYKADSGEFAGTLSKADHTPIVIDGLWGIAFGNGVSNQPTNTLFFAAGPADEAHGQYGRIDLQ
ncbi:NHL repeat family protein [Massilia sp. WF1]|uniref:TIGR03118 family protein n=1 Tax=unclassified Massilia TaxID=2609279 RepID=UPI00064ADBB4|nr:MULTISPECIES: TIGR03118 family protein [unclassified Massilia]ALK95944.1 hypothetical protein AM586_06225 [Massilia sp. WG5]KLU37475.1 NHL repeat family protein [Massilia sp. WF1]